MRSMAKSTASWTVAKVRGPMLSVRQWSRSRIVLPPWCQHHQQARRRSSGSSGNGVGITNGTNPWRSLPTNYSPGWSASGRERGLAADPGQTQRAPLATAGLSFCRYLAHLACGEMFLLSDMEAECEILKRRLAVMEKQ